MEDHEDPNEIVNYRIPKNETTPRFQHLALNSEGIKYLNEITNIVINELSSHDELKLLIIVHLLESDAILDELPSSYARKLVFIIDFIQFK